mgnify:CR=1 FL=1
MQFNAEAIEAANQGFQVVFDKGYTAATPWSAGKFIEVTGTGPSTKVLLPEGVGDMWQFKGKTEKRSLVVWDDTLEHLDFELNLEVPRNAFLDDNLGMYAMQFQLAGASAATHPDVLIQQLLVNGFSSNGADGTPFIGSTHPQHDGTASNLQTGALSETTFNAALATLQSQTDYYGRPLALGRMGGKLKLVVGPSLRATAKAICEAERKANGASNPNLGAAEVDVNERLVGDYADYWFVMYEGAVIRPFVIVNRSNPREIGAPDPNSAEAYKTRAVEYLIERRGNAGYAFWQAIVGSTGASE